MKTGVDVASILIISDNKFMVALLKMELEFEDHKVLLFGRGSALFMNFSKFGKELILIN